MKTYWIQSWPFPVFVGYVPSEAAWKRQMKRMGLDEPYPSSGGDARCTTFEMRSVNRTVCLITIRDPSVLVDNDGRLVELLTHEATHAWQQTTTSIGEESPSPEFEAYSLGHLVRGLFEAFKEAHAPR